MRKRSSARFAGPGTGTMVGGVGGEAARDAVAELLAEQAPAGSKPSLKEVCMALGQCWKSCAMDAFATAKAIIGGLTDKSRPVNVSLGGLLGLLFWCGVFASTLLMAFLRPSALSTLLMAVFVGLLIGLGLSFAYYANLAEKEEIRQVMATNIGLKGLASLLGHLPSWLAFSENEKMEWMNTILIELWPFVDAAVCKMVREMVEQVFADTIKSTGVPLKSITFNRLTFGDAPFRVEGIQVDTFDPDVLDMRLQVRWSGDANITLAIAVLNEATTLCPQVSDISFFGSLRVRAAPMTDKIPGFGAIMVTLERPPRFKYYLNFGTALGGAFIASVIKPFINSTIHNVLLNEMVWPQRIVAPVVFGEVDERTALAIARLGYYHQGLMKVELISGEDLPSEDLIGRNDPYVEFSTDGKYKAKSKVLRKSKHPKWNETLYLLVQEPDNQDMHVTCYDYDVMSAADVIGRCSIPVISVTTLEHNEPPHNALDWKYHLGTSLFSDPAGCGKGAGRLHMRLSYRSFESFKPQDTAECPEGIVAVKIMEVNGVPRRSKANMYLFAEVKCQGTSQLSTVVSAASEKPFVFSYRSSFEFYHTPDTAIVTINVYEKSNSGPDLLGSLETSVADISTARDKAPWTAEKQCGLMFLNHKRLDDIELVTIKCTMRFVPCP